MPRAKEPRHWMVEQMCRIKGGPTAPIRGIAQGATRTEAERNAPEAIRAAIRQIGGSDDAAEPRGEPRVLYEV